jgi:hypothetical protein
LPESIAARKEKKSEIDSLKIQIDAISNGKDDHEAPADRKQRLKEWLKEEQSSRGERGAIVRTAKREGISRQRLGQILK